MFAVRLCKRIGIPQVFSFNVHTSGRSIMQTREGAQDKEIFVIALEREHFIRLIVRFLEGIKERLIELNRMQNDMKEIYRLSVTN